jgi:hypothetical protein
MGLLFVTTYTLALGDPGTTSPPRNAIPVSKTAPVMPITLPLAGCCGQRPILEEENLRERLQ